MHPGEFYSDNSLKIYGKLYLQDGETVNDCHHRVADFLGNNNEEFYKFKKLLDDQIIRPNTPAMTNAGVKKNPNLCACYILDLEDSMQSIIDMWGTCARIYEGGGGAGIPITNLREEGSPISSGGEASGPLSYLHVIQSISDQVKSGGRSRRAANLISYWYDHPDAFKITNCKRDKESFQAMNLSMLVEDAFMDITRLDLMSQFSLHSPKKGLYESFNTSELWNQVLQAAWETGDPGLLFYDRINKDNPFPSLGDIICSNPCGEVVGMPWTSCVLGHINLNKVLGSDSNFNHAVYWGVLMLNRIIEKTSHPNEQFKEMMFKTKPIGLGFMGFADILYSNGIGYNSDWAKHFAETISQNLTQEAFNASIKLVEEGKIDAVQVPPKDVNHFRDYLRRFGVNSDCEHKVGNCMVTCIAPTGSTSISADCSYGFEPKFALTWKKHVDGGDTWTFLDEQFKQACEEYDIKLTDDLIKKIENNKGSIQGFSEWVFPNWMQEVFVTAHDIYWQDRIDMQAGVQKWITMSISSTVNLPNKATKEDIGEIYKHAWKQGLKGITIFRDGCLGDNQPVDFGGKDEDQNKQQNEEKTEMQKERPQVRLGKTVETKAPDGKLYVIGNYWDNQLKEIFISMSNQDNRTNHFLNSIGRILSRSLQHNVPLDNLLDTMRGGGGEMFFLKLNDDPSIRVSGTIDAVAHVIDKEFKEQTVKELSTNNQDSPDESDESDEHNKFDGYNDWLERCPTCGAYAWRRDGACRGGWCTNCGESNCL